MAGQKTRTGHLPREEVATIVYQRDRRHTFLLGPMTSPNSLCGHRTLGELCSVEIQASGQVSAVCPIHASAGLAFPCSRQSVAWQLVPAPGQIESTGRCHLPANGVRRPSARAGERNSIHAHHCEMVGPRHGLAAIGTLGGAPSRKTAPPSLSAKSGVIENPKKKRSIGGEASRGCRSLWRLPQVENERFGPLGNLLLRICPSRLALDQQTRHDRHPLNVGSREHHDAMIAPCPYRLGLE